MGDVVFYSDPILRDVVVMDPQWLVDVFKAIITAEEFIAKKLTSGKQFRQSKELTADVLQLLMTGTVTHRCLSALWQAEEVGFLTELLHKFDLIIPTGSVTGPDRTFLVPCMLPKPKEGDWNKVEFSEVLSPVLKNSHTSQFDELFPLDTFPNMVAACAKSWPIRENGLLSCRHVSYRITEGMVLALTQSHRCTITTSIWFDPQKHDQHPLGVVLETRAALANKLSACRIPPSSTSDIICPHWTRRDYHICTVEVKEVQDETASVVTKVQPVSTECTCHKEPLTVESFLKPKFLEKATGRPKDVSIFHTNLFATFYLSATTLDMLLSS